MGGRRICGRTTEGGGGKSLEWEEGEICGRTTEGGGGKSLEWEEGRFVVVRQREEEVRA